MITVVFYVFVTKMSYSADQSERACCSSPTVHFMSAACVHASHIYHAWSVAPSPFIAPADGHWPTTWP